MLLRPKFTKCHMGNLNKIILVGNVDMWHVSWQRVTYVYGCIHSEREYFESRDEDNRDVFKYLFPDGTNEELSFCGI